jgi:hypothetical protein
MWRLAGRALGQEGLRAWHSFICFPELAVAEMTGWRITGSATAMFHVVVGGMETSGSDGVADGFELFAVCQLYILRSTLSRSNRFWEFEVVRLGAEACAPGGCAYATCGRGTPGRP